MEEKRWNLKRIGRTLFSNSLASPNRTREEREEEDKNSETYIPVSSTLSSSDPSNFSVSPLLTGASREGCRRGYDEKNSRPSLTHTPITDNGVPKSRRNCSTCFPLMNVIPLDDERKEDLARNETFNSTTCKIKTPEDPVLDKTHFFDSSFLLSKTFDASHSPIPSMSQEIQMPASHSPHDVDPFSSPNLSPVQVTEKGAAFASTSSSLSSSSSSSSTSAARIAFTSMYLGDSHDAFGVSQMRASGYSRKSTRDRASRHWRDALSKRNRENNRSKINDKGGKDDKEVEGKQQLPQPLSPQHSNCKDMARKGLVSFPAVLRLSPPTVSSFPSQCFPTSREESKRIAAENDARCSKNKAGAAAAPPPPSRSNSNGSSNSKAKLKKDIYIPQLGREKAFAGVAQQGTEPLGNPSPLAFYSREGKQKERPGGGGGREEEEEQKEKERKQHHPSRGNIEEKWKSHYFGEPEGKNVPLMEAHEHQKGDSKKPFATPTSPWGIVRSWFLNKDLLGGSGGGDDPFLGGGSQATPHSTRSEGAVEVKEEEDGRGRGRQGSTPNSAIWRGLESPSKSFMWSRVPTNAVSPTGSPSLTSLPKNTAVPQYSHPCWKQGSPILFSRPQPPMIRQGFASSFPERRRRALLRSRSEVGEKRRGRMAAHLSRGERVEDRLAEVSEKIPEGGSGGGEEVQGKGKRNNKRKKGGGWWWNDLFRVNGNEWEEESENLSNSSSSDSSHSRVNHGAYYPPGQEALTSERRGESEHEGRAPGEGDEAIDLVTVFQAYLESYSEGMMNIVEASLLIRSKERQNLVTFEELTYAEENPVLIRLTAMKKVLDTMDPRVQQTVSNVVHKLIEESSGDELNPALQNFLEVFFAFPFISLTKAEYNVLKKSGIEFVSLMHHHRHVLPKGHICFSICFNYSFFAFCVNVFFLLLGFLLNCLVAIGIIMEIIFWLGKTDRSDSISRGFYACIAIGAGYILMLMTVTVILRPSLLASAHLVPRDQREPSLYFLVVPLIPLYDLMCLAALLRIKRKEWELLALHNIFAMSRIMMFLFCLFYGFPQLFLASTLVNMGAWMDNPNFNLVLFPSQFLRSVVLFQFSVMTFRLLCSSLLYTSTHLFGFGWPGITKNRHGIESHDGMSRVLVLVAAFIAEAHICLFLFSILRIMGRSCWVMPVIIGSISCVPVLVVAVVYGILLRSIVASVVGLLRYGLVCSVVLTLSIIPLLVLLMFNFSGAFNKEGEAGSAGVVENCAEDLRFTLQNDFGPGFAIQFTFLGLVVLWVIQVVYLLLRYGCGIGLSCGVKDWFHTLVAKWTLKREKLTRAKTKKQPSSPYHTDQSEGHGDFNEPFPEETNSSTFDLEENDAEMSWQPVSVFKSEGKRKRKRLRLDDREESEISFSSSMSSVL